MASIKSLRSNLKAESEGIWFTHPSGVKFKIARSDHPASAASWRTVTRHISRDGSIDLEDNKVMRLVASHLAKHIVRDWENLESEDGNTVEFSPAECELLLADPELRDLATWVLQKANEGENYRQSMFEEDMGK